jgi:dihydropteroate synthase
MNTSAFFDFKVPKVVGILNLTPDSFYDGGNLSKEDVLSKVEKMLLEGASGIDIGGMSSRPGAGIISPNVELERILPTLKILLKEFPNALFSVDTIHAETAKICLDEGVKIINDISGGEYDSNMLSTVVEFDAGIVLMHMRGTPTSMQKLVVYDDLMAEIKNYFVSKIANCKELGIKNIIIDPGLGFSKTLEQNYHLLRHIESFQTLNTALMVGISRKSMIQKVIDKDATQSLNGSTVLHTIALLNGANILRVHDVGVAVEAVKLVDFYKKSSY